MKNIYFYWYKLSNINRVTMSLIKHDFSGQISYTEKVMNELLNNRIDDQSNEYIVQKWMRQARTSIGLFHPTFKCNRRWDHSNSIYAKAVLRASKGKLINTPSFEIDIADGSRTSQTAQNRSKLDGNSNISRHVSSVIKDKLCSSTSLIAFVFNWNYSRPLRNKYEVFEAYLTPCISIIV